MHKIGILILLLFSFTATLFAADTKIILENEIITRPMVIIFFVPNFGTNILPAIWLEIRKDTPNDSIAKPRSDSSICNLSIFQGIKPK